MKHWNFELLEKDIISVCKGEHSKTESCNFQLITIADARKLRWQIGEIEFALAKILSTPAQETE